LEKEFRNHLEPKGTLEAGSVLFGKAKGLLELKKKNGMVLISLISLCVWGFLLYSNTLRAPFLFDDEEYILKNPAIRQIGSPELWKIQSYRARIVGFTSFAMNYRVGRYRVIGYHLVNVAIHTAVSLLVIVLLLLIFKTPRMRGSGIAEHGRKFAFLTGALFAVHPIQTQAVTYISQRFECLAGFFYMLSLCLYLKGRLDASRGFSKAFCFILATVSALLGAFTKETVFTLPGAIFLVEWVFLKEPVSANALSEPRASRKTFWISMAGVCFLFLVVLWFLPVKFNALFESHARMGITSGKYFLTQLEVIPRYIGLLLVPLRQNFDPDIRWVSGWFDGPVLVNAIVLFSVLCSAVWAARRFPLVAFGVLWFFLTLSVTSSFIPLKDPMMEHRLYLPSIGFLMALCAGLYDILRNRRIFFLIMTGWILVFSWLTFLRNDVWGHEIRFWKDCIKKSPHKARPYVNLGVAYRKRGAYRQAITAYETALKYQPGYKEPLAQLYTNLGAVYGQMGDYVREIRYCHQAIELDPTRAQAYSNLGYAYAMVGDMENAIRYGTKAIKRAPLFGEAWNNLGVTYGMMGQYEKAGNAFQTAVRINPCYGAAQRNLRLAKKKKRERHSS